MGKQFLRSIGEENILGDQAAAAGGVLPTRGTIRRDKKSYGKTGQKRIEKKTKQNCVNGKKKTDQKYYTEALLIFLTS